MCVCPACMPGACRATGRGLQPSGMRVKQVGDFKVDTRNAGSGELKVLVKGPSEYSSHCRGFLETQSETRTSAFCSWSEKRSFIVIVNDGSCSFFVMLAAWLQVWHCLSNTDGGVKHPHSLYSSTSKDTCVKTDSRKSKSTDSSSLLK